MERAVRLIVTGRVQGVGYRAFVEDRAEALDLAGWVRNRRDGSVEVVVAGHAEAVEAMVSACRNGPRAANVAEVKITDHAGPPLARFTLLPTE
ncbi:MAG: acylphosphatase [Bauldia sp.]